MSEYDDLKDSFDENFEELILGLGQTIKIVGLGQAPCPNCVFDPLTGGSTGTYNPYNQQELTSGFNIPFPAGGVCPVCNNSGKIPIISSAIGLVNWNPRNLKIKGDVVLNKNLCELKFSFDSFSQPDLIDNASYFLVPTNEGIEVKCQALQNPAATGLGTKKFITVYCEQVV